MQINLYQNKNTSNVAIHTVIHLLMHHVFNANYLYLYIDNMGLKWQHPLVLIKQWFRSTGEAHFTSPPHIFLKYLISIAFHDYNNNHMYLC